MEDIHPIGIGANIFGYSTNFKETKNILSSCSAYGLNLIDTADVYTNNLSEKYIGRIINSKGFKNKFYISTKAGLQPHESAFGKYTKQYLNKSVNSSLKRLKIDCIDFYLLHRFDSKNDLFEIMTTLQDLSEDGKIKYFGFSNLTLNEFNKVMKNKKYFRNLKYNQSLYNIFCEENIPIIKNCKKNKIFSTTYGALLRGILSEKYLSKTISKKSRFYKSKKVQKHLSIKMLKFIRELSVDLHIFKMNIAQFAIYNSIISGSQTTIVGMRNSSQVRNICKNFDLKQLNNAKKIRKIHNKKISKFNISYY